MTSTITKCFERLVMARINSSVPDNLDPLQFAYCRNRSTTDAISLALHSALEHLDSKDTYVRLLFIDYSSVFNTIIPSKLVTKLQDLGLNTSLCNWILDFLTNRLQSVRIGSNTSGTIILNTGAPQGCILSLPELVIDFRKGGGIHAPVYINGAQVERVESVKLLGVNITNSLSWSNHVDAMAKKAHQRLYFLRRIKKFGLSPLTLTNFY
ncbi:uncharacterized protein LOC127575722 [Pristis pectinata]|uniref:uncharacterized protein LOC127575722 n=1 Tax=Pristis pectinata TaxID=685728 RepID=UPI00223D84BD|nr:uncharacterized protein LOC127575722 [Pristis pectinata]